MYQNLLLKWLKRIWMIGFLGAFFLINNNAVVEVVAGEEIDPIHTGEDIPDNWLAQAQAAIREREYHLTWVETPLIVGVPSGYQAPNRAQNFRTYFQPDSLYIIPRTAEQPIWVWRLNQVGFGRGTQVTPFQGSNVDVQENRIVYRSGWVEQEFINAESGLSQTFTLLSSPGLAQDEPLTIRVEIGGDFTAHRTMDGDLQFRFSGEPVMDYGSLRAMDFNGNRLPARFAIGSQLNQPGKDLNVELVVDDREAQYPLTISLLISGLDPDPDWWHTGGLHEVEAGFSVATAGDVNGDLFSDIIISEPGFDSGGADSGLVSVFHGHPYGPEWDSPDWWEHGDPGSRFGASVSTAGDVNGDGYADIIIGAPQWDDDGVTHYNGGKAYVYYGSGDGLLESPGWSLASGQTGARLGQSVAPAGDLNGDGFSDVVVGAPEFDVESLYDIGRVFVQYGTEGGLPEGFAWFLTGLHEYDNFGYSVATAGDVNFDYKSDLVIGAPYEDSSGKTDNGSARIYLGSSSKTTSPGVFRTLMGENHSDYFGWSVATAGDVNGDGFADVLVGAPQADIHADTITAEGEAYLFYGHEEMDIYHDWRARGDDPYGQLGFSVATAGDVNADGYSDVIVGQPFWDNTEGIDDEGRAMIWLGGETGLGNLFATPEDADWMTRGWFALSYYGYSVATAGDVNQDGRSDILVGAPNYSSFDWEYEGFVFLYFGGWTDLSHTAGWTYEWPGSPEASGTAWGRAVATAGDVNGDGFADILIGAPYYDGGQIDEGAAFVFHGSPTGPAWDFAWYARGGQESAYFGWTVNSAGDVNGDGYSDIIIGAPNFDYFEYDEGMVFVWLGSSSGLGNSVTNPIAASDWFAQSNTPYAYLGRSAASAGDVNGDGYFDVVAGAPDYDKDAIENRGLVLVWRGGASGLGTNGTIENADWAFKGPYANGYLGLSVATAGDVNADGFSDVIAGGVAHAKTWYGSRNGLRAVDQDWIVWGYTNGLGASVSTAGDINGDGYSDVVIGAPLETLNYAEEGAIFAYCGGESGLAAYACFWDYGDKPGAHLGISVNTAGDVNGDGYADMVAGAPHWAQPTANEGQARVYYGADGGPILNSHGDWVVESNTIANMGIAVASAGDVNGDAFADVLVGGSAFDYGGGKTYLYYGNGAPGRTFLVRQIHPRPGNYPLHNLGAVRGYEHFYMQITGHSITGSGQVRMQTELKPLGTLFTGTGAAADALWQYPTVSGTTLTGTGLNIVPGRSYHWRIRLQNNPVTSPFAPPATRWMHVPWNGWNEADFRSPLSYVYIPLVVR